MKSLSKQWNRAVKFWSLSPQDKWLLIQAFSVLIVYKCLLTFIPFNQFIGKKEVVTALRPLPEEKIRATVWAVKVVNAYVPLGFTCLIQALGTKWLLRDHPDIQLRIGVQKSAIEGFSAHAWIEYKGKIILGEQTGQVFEPILAWK
ncbi:lasso peptide biosynthesis B2 protein [Fibrisoma limi]|uniref:lasso peptide biosynthesis B2 protein n=1 Tax=Fibrisoma limi TaxID=663275 RepID=UPI0006881ADD|nr:lasso peptide biosynthesis B2 protein [Fibrisoma limi]